MNSCNKQNSKDPKSNESAMQQQKIKHMKLLHEYNNLKDATQAVLEALAQARGLPVRDMHTLYNLPSSE